MTATLKEPSIGTGPNKQLTQGCVLKSCHNPGAATITVTVLSTATRAWKLRTGQSRKILVQRSLAAVDKKRLIPSGPVYSKGMLQSLAAALLLKVIRRRA